MRASDIKDYKYERECKDDEMLNRSSRRARKAHKILFYTHGFSSQVGWNDYARILPTAHLLHWNKNNTYIRWCRSTQHINCFTLPTRMATMMMFVARRKRRRRKKWINFLFIFIIIPPLFCLYSQSDFCSWHLLHTWRQRYVALWMSKEEKNRMNECTWIISRA